MATTVVSMIREPVLKKGKKPSVPHEEYIPLINNTTDSEDG
jgi:hypothetical protein